MARDVKRSVTIAGHRTSLSLEPLFWEALKELACSHEVSVNELVREIDDRREPDENLSSAIRVHILSVYRSRTGVCSVGE